MWNRAKSAGRLSRPDYECRGVQKVQEDFQDQSMNVEACEECRKNVKTRLKMWKCEMIAETVYITD